MSSYYAVQAMSVDATTRKLIASRPVLHVFDSRRQRDEWVERGQEAHHRSALSAQEAKSVLEDRSDGHPRPSAVRHKAVREDRLHHAEGGDDA